MNRNVESHFSKIPTANIPRSSFDTSAETITTFNAGELIPLLVKEVYPGDTFSVTSSKVIRAQTLLNPIFGNMYLDTYWFYVPNRLVWTHWAEFTGESKDSPWISSTQYNLPRIKSPENGWSTGTIADYMGIPTGVKMSGSKHIPQALPFRGYAMICNEFFRDENLTDPLNIPTGDANQTGSNGDDFVNDVANGGMPFKVARYHDYYSSCLPQPSRGDPVDVPVDVVYNKDARLPVTSFNKPIPFNEFMHWSGTPESGQFKRNVESDPSGFFPQNSPIVAPLYFSTLPLTNSVTAGEERTAQAFFTYARNPGKKSDVHNPSLNPDYPVTRTWTDHTYNTALTDNGFSESWDGTNLNTKSSDTADKQSWMPVNLWTAKLSDYLGIEGSTFDINGLRLAYATQRYLEASARGGNRYRESLLCHFGVRSPDARLDVPEYLGGNRTAIQVREVTNNAQTETEFLGDLGAVSRTVDIHSDFTKSFTEHGFLFCLACVRYDHVYSQGLERFWMRDDFLSFYTPEFANIGEQPVWSDELMYDDDNEDNVFGYQEAWADLRYGVNHLTSEMRVSADQPFNSWHLGDFYDTVPTLSDDWIREDKSNVDRVLAVQSSQSKQFFGDFYFKMTAVRAMPMFSIPKLGESF